MKSAVGNAWKYIRDIQRGRAVLKPTKPKAVRKLDGALCTTPVESLQRWQQHFNSVLNTTSVFSFNLINSFPSSDVHSELADVPSLDENRNVYQGISLVCGSQKGL